MSHQVDREINAEQEVFKSERIEREASFMAQAPIDKVFPLFGPIREMEWAAGWEPEIIVGADLQLHTIFKTPSGFAEEPYYLWAITQCLVSDHKIEYTVSTANRIWFITVACEPVQDKTKVTVRYRYTSLTPLGNRLNQLALKEMFAQNLSDWEEAMNYYLATGKRLE